MPDADRPEGSDQVWTRADSARFGFADTGLDADEAWLRHLRAAVRPRELGSGGPDDLFEEVSRGAQGIVYRAVERATERVVAVKRLIAGAFATPASLRRFEREIEATCLLHHPGIVSVYGVFHHGDTPFLAMEWVDGVPITACAACERRSVPELLRMFLRVCDAVQHAHQNGVLHRDLKPSNILVEEDGTPHVVDFGLAKLLDPADDDSRLTLSSGFVGTPAYASPEQIEGGAARVDVRSDVYSLGVLLYEMLTGERPYRADAGLRELLAAHDREDSAPPSTLRPECNREVDAICAMALAVTPGERYQTVSALAEDVGRHLAGDAVRAHPPSRWYQLRKAVRRNPLTASLLALLFLSTGTFSALVLRQAGRLEVEKTRAEDAERGVRKAFGFLLSELVVSADPLLGERDLTVVEAIARVDERAADVFSDKPLFELEVRDALAKTYFGLQRYNDAAVQLERAVALGTQHRPDDAAWLATLRARLGRALLHTGATEEAGELLAGAEATLRAAAGDNAFALATTLDCIARWHRDSGRNEEAEAPSREAIRLLLAHDRANDGEPSVEELQTLKGNLALTLLHLGRVDEAHELYTECLAILDSLPGIRAEVRKAGVLSNLAVIQHKKGDHVAAVETARREIEICERVYGPDHQRVAVGEMNLALGCVRLEQWEAAEAALRRSIDILEGSSRGAPSMAHELLGEVLGHRGAVDEALRQYDRAAKRRAERRGPDAFAVAKTRIEMAALLVDADRCEEALPLLGTLLEAAERFDYEAEFKVRALELEARCR